MKLQSDKRILETSGLNEDETGGFKIQQNAKAFEVLSSNIYSDKVLAVVRELACNAWDAHIEAGTEDTPFEIHLPSSIEPWFSIKDYGVGLSHDNVMNLYTTYFDSTKGDSNFMTGALGLGSKSPFCYSEQFTVTSRFEGMKRIYNAFIGEAGAPQITLISESDSDEPSGLEVHMAVEQQDFNTFKDRARNVLARFPVLPLVDGVEEFVVPTVDIMTEGSNFKIRRESYRYGQSYRAYATQGLVAYPIDKHSFSSDLTDKQRAVIDMPIDIVFPLGELNITASRERLNYDRRTEANIIKTLDQVYNELPKLFENLFDNAKTLWEAKLLHSEWQKSSSIPREIRELVKENLKWNGHVLGNKSLSYTLFDDISEPTGELDSEGNIKVDRDGKALMDGKIETWGTMILFGRGVFQYKKITGERKVHGTVMATPETVLIYDDVGQRKINDKVDYHFRDAGKTVYLLQCPEDRLPEVKKQIGDVEFELWSDYSEPPVEYKETVKNATIPVLEFRPNGYWDTWTTASDHNAADGGVYVITKAKEACRKGEDGPQDDPGGNHWLKELYSAAKELELIDEDKYEIKGIQATHRNIPNKYPGWVHVEDDLRPKVEKFMETLNFDPHKMKATLDHLREWNRDLEMRYVGDWVNFFVNENRYKQLKVSSPMRKLVEAYVELRNQLDELGGETYLRSILSIYERFGYKIYKNRAPYVNLRKPAENLHTKYPLLAWNIRGRGYGAMKGQASTFIHYVTLCDAKPSLVPAWKEEKDE